MTDPLRFIPPPASSARKRKRVVLTVQPVNTDAVRAFVRDCMVPILAKEFLRLREAAPSAPTSVTDEEWTPQPVGKEDGI